MSYDLNLYIPVATNDIIDPWMQELKNLGMECEVHPEFRFEDHSGFLPFNVKVLKKFIIR